MTREYEIETREEEIVRAKDAAIAALLERAQEAEAARDKAQAERADARADAARLAEVLRRVVKYAREDRVVTPGYTRLARLIDGDVTAALAAHIAGSHAGVWPTLEEAERVIREAFHAGGVWQSDPGETLSTREVCEQRCVDNLLRRARGSES